jgi:hypothetical protein
MVANQTTVRISLLTFLGRLLPIQIGCVALSLEHFVRTVIGNHAATVRNNTAVQYVTDHVGHIYFLLSYMITLYIRCSIVKQFARFLFLIEGVGVAFDVIGVHSIEVIHVLY